MMLKKFNDAIWEVVSPTSNTSFTELFYNSREFPKPPKLFDKRIKYNEILKFLNSTMDETRSNHALKCREIILNGYDCKDLEFISKGVLRREVSGDITYTKQRDHFSHTLNNFLLGTYIFEKSNSFKKEFKKVCKNLKKYVPSLNEIKPNNKVKWDDGSIFYSVWFYVSLLHDMGYIFEGALHPLNTNVQQQQIKVGAEVINDFFQHQFWKSSDLTIFSSIHSKEVIINATKVSLPTINYSSILAVADSLRQLKHTDEFKDYLKIIFGNYYSVDIFDIWKQYFKRFKNKYMSELVDLLREYFESVSILGRDKSGLRLLDHGICSGLIIFHYTNLFYELIYQLENLDETEYKKHKKIFEDFFGPKSAENKYDIEFDSWWGLLVWASVATAFHNALQEKEFITLLKQSDLRHKKLQLSDDPLTYLGILVDILQQWDRYNVDSGAIFNNIKTIQNNEVYIGKNKKQKKIKIKYINEDIKNDVIEALDNSLYKWSDIIEVI